VLAFAALENEIIAASVADPLYCCLSSWRSRDSQWLAKKWVKLLSLNYCCRAPNHVVAIAPAQTISIMHNEV
jgi:hypothetical protein